MSDESNDIQHPKFDVDIKTQASPEEVLKFAELVEDHGYEVITDLEKGRIRLRGDLPDD